VCSSDLKNLNLQYVEATVHRSQLPFRLERVAENVSASSRM
jgi:hypothetical protein